MNKRRILVMGLAMVVLLVVLAAGLQTLEFRAGHAMLEPKEPEPGGLYTLPLPYALMRWLLDRMPWIILAVLILGAVVFRRKLFEEVFRLRILIICIVMLAVFGLRPWYNQPPVDEEQPTEVEEEVVVNLPGFFQPVIPPPDWSEDTPQEQPAALPGWVTYLAAAAVAVPVVWLGWWLARQAARRYRKREDEEELREVAAQAAADLRAGLSLEEVVIRCWARMAEILAGRAGGTAPAITPRELAQLLAEWGVRDEAVAELTWLFEEVRYGGRADAPRRERALAALEAIEEAYGPA